MSERTGGPSVSTYEHDGLTLGYSVIGAGSPVLFVHGATGTGEYEWGELAARLSPHFRCILPDLRGHGRSGYRRSGYTGEAVCGDLRQLIEHLKLDRPHIVGFSYGSEISLMLELDEPGIARSLVLVSPGTGRAEGERLPSVAYMHRTWPSALRRLHDAQHGSEHWRSLVTTLVEDAATRRELSMESLASVDCPILLVSGDRDERTRRAQALQFAEVNPRARLVDVAGAAHAAHLDSPAEVAKAVSDFLTEVDHLGRGGHHGATRVG
jgi:pimeloyl-ACP methyl ester carboxylesterase